MSLNELLEEAMTLAKVLEADESPVHFQDNCCRLKRKLTECIKSSKIVHIEGSPSVKKSRSLSFNVRAGTPTGISVKAFRSALIPIYDDYEAYGNITYLGFNKMANGSMCFNFSGYCPVHKKTHSQTKHQFKLYSAYAVFKCWKGDGFIKMPKPEIFDFL